MAELVSATDNLQQKVRERNLRLADLLQTTWKDKNIQSVRRDPPVPTNPDPDETPKIGKWIATTSEET